MAKFANGEFVRYTAGKGYEFARIVGRDGNKYRIFTFGRRQYVADGRLLRNGKPAVLILESNLSGGREALLTDRQRRSGIFLEELFRSIGYLVLREKVHSVPSLKHFIQYGKKDDVLFVHWSGHGLDEEIKDGKNRCTTIKLSVDEIYLPIDEEDYLKASLERGRYRRDPIKKANRDWIIAQLKEYENLREIFSGLNGRILLLSACDLGKPKGLAQYISKISEAKAVIAYEGYVTDGQANLAEALLYIRLYTMETKKRTPGVIVKEVSQMLQESLGQKIPLVCYVAGNKVA